MTRELPCRAALFPSLPVVMENSRNCAAAHPLSRHMSNVSYETTETEMKLTAITLGAIAIVLSTASASAADAKKYCLNPASGGSSCGYTSLAQCQATMNGRNGWCTEQVDFDRWYAERGMSVPMEQNGFGRPENSFAYYPRGGVKQRRMSQDEKDIQAVYKKDMPSRGVGAE
jgi:hypothetical protein